MTERAYTGVHFATVIDTLPDATAVFDIDGRYLMSNAKYRELLFDPDNYPIPGEAMIHTARRIVDAKRIAGLDQLDPDHATLALMIDPFSFMKDVEIALNDGRVIRGSSTPWGRGGFLISIRDMGRERLGEWRAVELLSNGFDTADLGMIMWNASQKIEIANDAWQTLVRQTEIGDDVVDVFTALCDDGLLAAPDETTAPAFVNAALAAAHSESQTFTLSQAAGRSILISTFTVFSGRVIATAIDLSARQTAQAAANAMLRDTVEALDIGLMLLDADLNLLMMNDVAKRIILADGRALSDQPHLSEVIGHLVDLGALSGAARQTAITDFVTFAQSFATGYRPKWKDKRVYEFSSVPTKMGGVLISVRDLTDEIALHNALDAQRAAAAQSEKLSALGGLLAGVAHELSNPLSVVVGYAKMLQNEVDIPAAQQKLERISTAADRCVRIVKMFLALARERPALVEPCDVVPLVQTAITLAGGGTTQHRIETRFASALPRVAADPDHLCQVFSNLITNALHAVRSRGPEAQIDIGVHASEGQVVVEIKDNGPGIPLEIQSRIYEPFFTTKEVGDGTGFGLAFSHRTVTAHGGTLRFESVMGLGTRFIVALPVATDFALGSELPPRDTPTRPENHRVLVVDDDEMVGQMLTDILDQAGHTARAVQSARDALSLCAEHNYDVIVCDMRMPDMDGQRFYHTLEAKVPAAAERVIFLTGDTLNPGVAAFIAQSGRPYLEKPIVPKEFTALIAGLAKSKGQPHD